MGKKKPTRHGVKLRKVKVGSSGRRKPVADGPRVPDQRLAEALEQQAATTEILRLISTSPADAQPVFDAIVKSAARLCEADSSAVARFDGAILHLVSLNNMAADEMDSFRGLFPRPAVRGYAMGRAILDGRTVHLDDIFRDPEYDRQTQERLLRAGRYRTYLAVPILRNGIPVGVIGCSRREVRPFSAAQIALVETFAEQAVIAIENVRLFADLAARNRDLTETLEQQMATGEILRVISSSPTDVQPVLDTVATSAARLCESFDAAIWRRDGDRLLLVAHHGPIPVGRIGEFSLPLIRGTVAGRSAVDGQTVHVADAQAEGDDFPESSENARRMGFRTILSVPLMRKGAAIGSIQVRRTETLLFTDRQVALLETFADQAVIAIENVRLFTELEARNRALTESLEQQTATSEILRVISSSPTDVQPVFDSIAAAASTLCAAENAGVFLFDGTLIHFAAHHNWTVRDLEAIRQSFPRPPGTGSVTARAILTRAVAHTPDISADPEYDVSSLIEAGFRAVLSVPMLRNGDPIGAINVIRRDPIPFTDTQIALLETFARQAVIAIQNVRLFTELEARNRDLTESLEQQTATGEILRVISSSPTDVQPVFDSIAQSAARLCETELCFVFRMEDELLRFVAHHGLNAEGLAAVHRLWPAAGLRPNRGSAAARSALLRSIVHIADVEADPDYQMGDIAAAATFRGTLAVPMLRDGIPIGVITVLRARTGLFSDRQIALLQTFADQAVIAIENVRLFKALEARNRDLTETLEQQTATADILRVISSSPTDVKPVFDTIVQNAQGLCGADSAGVLTYDGELLHIEALVNAKPEQASALRSAYPMPANRAHASGRAILTGRPAHIPDVREDPEYTLDALRDTVGLRSVLSVPMIRDGIPVGAITVQKWGAPRPFSDKQITLLMTFADQAVIAIQNVRLFKELDARNRELTETLEQQTATSELLKVIGRSTFDLQPVFETLAENAVRLCKAERAFIWRPDGEVLRAVVIHNASPELRVFAQANPITPGRSSGAAQAALERRTVHIPDALADPDYTFGVQQVDPIRTVLAIPMLRADELLGVIAIYRLEVNPFTDSQIALLETFADQAAIAIENARLLSELQARNADLTETLEQQTATSEILGVISSSPTDVQPVFDTIARNARRLCNADSGSVFTFDGSLVHLQALDNTSAERSGALRSSYPLAPTSGSVSGRVILTRQPVHIADVREDADYVLPGLQDAGLRSVLGVPMLRDGLAVGLIIVHTWESPRPFTRNQIDLLKTFADQAVIAIENVRLFKELEVRNRDLTETLEQQTATSELLKVIGRSTFDLQPVFETLVENAVRLCAAERGVILRFDGRFLRFAVGHNLSAELREYFDRDPIAPGRQTNAGRAALERRTVHNHDVLSDPEYSYGGTQVDPYRTVLAIPMLRADELLGVILIYRHEVRPFTDSQVALMETFADQAAIAIENARLLSELQSKNADLTETLEQQTATGEILRVISSSPTDVQPVFDTIAQSAKRLCEAEFCHLFRFDGELIHFVGHHGLTSEGIESIRRAYPMAPGRVSAAARAILSGRIEHIPDVHADPDYGHGAIARVVTYRSIVAVPMMRDGHAVGAIAVARSTVGLFPNRQLELLQTFADQAVIAIENVRLFRELEVRNQDLTETLEQQTATGEILRVISESPTDVQPVFETILRNAVRLCDAHFALLYRLEAETVQLVAHHNFPPAALEQFRSTFSHRLSDGGTIAALAMRRAEVVHVHDIETHPGVSPPARELARESGYRSVLAVPIMRDGHPLGAIAVTRSDATGSPRPFSDTEIALLRTFTDQAVIAIENVRLFQELEARTEDLTRSVGELKALGEVSQAVSSTLDLETVLATVVSHAVQLSGSHGGVVYEFDEATQSFHARATHQITAEHLEALRAAPIRLGEGAIGHAGVIREPVQIADIQAERQLVAPQAREHLISQGMRSLLAMPLIREDRLLGGLVITRREVGAFSPGVVTTLQTFAAQSVLAFQNARLFREIQRQKQYSEMLVEASPVAIATMDLHGAVVGWNPGAERLFGYPQAEALGHQMEDLVGTPEIREAVRANIRQTLEGEWIRAIAQRARKDGTLVDVEISSMPVVVDGARVGMIAIYHDISELLSARQEAEAANEAKSAFLATMSHEIRTPMNAVIGMSGLLLNTALTDEQREYAEVVRQSSDTLLTVINDILDFSKIEAGRLELESQPFDLRECIESALDLVAPRAAEKGLDLAYLIADGTAAAVLGDVTRLRQVLLNLLSNAVKFTEAGEVVLSVGARRDGSGRLHDLTFSVRDTGIGIPPDRLDRLFQSFSQVDASTTRRYGGSGLGLAISQRLTELMGGRITVTSQVGVGSEFRFTIRASAAESPLPARRDLSGVQPSLHGKRVLVVDDNATNRRILTAHLDAWGMRARASESPIEALTWIRGGERFDAGILDMHMPEMDGVALAQAIREQLAGAPLPLILFTSLGRREARAEEAGFAAYLNKPIKPSQLFDALVSVLAEQTVHVPLRRTTRSELDPEMAARHPLRILLAEDNAVNQKVALRILGQMGYRADVAANGLEAIEAVERQTYDVVLMDVQMPELDGFEASREINRRWPGERRPRLVAMTANAMEGDRELCLAAGMDDYVAKPIRVEELVAALGRSRPRGDAGPRPPTDAGHMVAPAAAAAIDRAAFDRLTATMDDAFVVELIDTFLEDARGLIASIRRAMAGADRDAFRRAAHSLKSTGESLGATDLANLARELETIGRSGVLSDVGDRIERLTGQYELVTIALGALRHGLAR